ncbi:hypothetical protein C7460_103224 [Marinoscillum furvescens DSM 4134]|uniref:Uncharacterized protein n=1 Tax=Marinoscillum furvescens DSM 4134 TaxID=1122208 RepID=A0A3D9L6B5_MARFU|nr:hypothetical protein C7460_103224 [Marinoscillum furvescens DSM 4134]
MNVHIENDIDYKEDVKYRVGVPMVQQGIPCDQ